MRDITAAELRALQASSKEKSYLLVDVRNHDEYHKGHLAGAVLLPLHDLPERIEELPQDRDIIFYCRTGVRSRAAATALANLPGFQGEVLNLNGGIIEWEGVTLPGQPRLHLFPPTNNQADSLLQAMSLERGAAKVYDSMLARYGDMDWAATLKSMAAEEVVHARLLYKALQQYQEHLPAFEELYRQVPDDLIEGGFSRENIEVELARPDGAPCRVVYELALAIEYSAYDLYRSLAQRFRQDVIAEVFLGIAQAEKMHLRRAAEALARCQH